MIHRRQYIITLIGDTEELDMAEEVLKNTVGLATTHPWRLKKAEIQRLEEKQQEI